MFGKVVSVCVAIANAFFRNMKFTQCLPRAGTELPARDLQ
jgi:hypothetical protein